MIAFQDRHVTRLLLYYIYSLEGICIEQKQSLVILIKSKLFEESSCIYNLLLKWSQIQFEALLLLTDIRIFLFIGISYQFEFSDIIW